MKKVFLILACLNLIFIITSCSAKPAAGETAKGLSIESLGLSAALTEKVDFKNTNPNELKDDPFLLMAGGIENGQINSFDTYYTGTELEGQFTVVCASAGDLLYVVDYIPVAYWQGFEKSQLEKAKKVVRVKGLKLTEEQLKNYLIYEDEDVVVYDFTSLILPGDYQKYLNVWRAMVAEEKEYNYDWVENLHDYVEKNASKMISRVKELDKSKNA
ncbi:MAG: hypothetical protein JG769_474 [Oscillospiraceae bacterium]|jgi:hypothetical protein|nr:hypothetical protein [Oscillospiraceae bacterium]